MGNLKVEGATIRMFNSTTVFTGVTDQNGKCDVPNKYYNDNSLKMDVTKVGYWPYVIPPMRSATAILSPEGWIRLHVRGAYPAEYGYFIKMTTSPVNQLWGDILIFDAPAKDSVVLVKAYGGEENKIEWYSSDWGGGVSSSGKLSHLAVPKFDYLDVSLNY